MERKTMKDYSLLPIYNIFDSTVSPPTLAFAIREDPDGHGCVCLEDADSMMYMPPEVALLVAEALIKMAEHLKKK